MATPAATAAPATQLPSLSWLPWLLLAVIAGAGIQPLLSGKRDEAIGKLQCEAQLSEARGKLGFLEKSSETEAQRMRQLEQELAAVKQSELQLRREAETRRDTTPEQTLPEQLRALMEVQHLLVNGPQARRGLLGLGLVRQKGPSAHISPDLSLPRRPYLAAVHLCGGNA